jgi:hypothetical protein
MHHTIEHVAENQRLDLATAQQVAAEKSAQYGIDDYGMISTFHVDAFIKEVRERMAAAGIPTPPYKWAAGQAQDSTFDQLTRLLGLANKNGLYDAADWLQIQLTQWSAKWKRGAKKAFLLQASPWDNDPQFPNFQRTSSLLKSAEDEEDNPECLCHHRFYDHNEQGICDICGYKGCPGFDPIHGDNKVFLGSFEQNDNVLKQPGTSRFLTVAECKQAFHDTVTAAGGHYVWEANGDQAVIISPDHDMRVLRFEDAQPFWETLFGLEDQIDSPEELQNAIDEVCKKYFDTPVDPTTYFYEPPKTACSPAQDEADAAQGHLNRLGSDFYDPNATGYTNEPHDAEDHELGSRSHIGGKPKAPGALHNRIEKASETLAELWPQAPKAAQHGYAITHHLNSVQMLLKDALSKINAYPEIASQKISQAENTLRTATDQIKHLKL